MNTTLFIEQALNGLQYGLMLFLLAAGLTIVFGVMDMINLAHGSLYMVGAFIAAWLAARTGSFWLGMAGAPPPPGPPPGGAPGPPPAPPSRARHPSPSHATSPSHP